MNSQERRELAREMANKLSKLLIVRRDVKAIQRPASDGGEWFASRKPLTLEDFVQHLFGSKCLGTYLLDPSSKIKFVAFDIDCTPEPAQYFKIHDIDKIDEAAYEAAGELDLDLRVGSWEQALHDKASDGYRWVRSHIAHLCSMVAERVETNLGLPALPVITGGGAHVIVPFGHKVEAAEGRAAAHGVMETVHGFTRISENFYSNAPDINDKDPKTNRPVAETVTIEIFPKQDRLSNPEGLGNLIRLPFGWHDQAQIRTYVMDLDPNLLPPWRLPKRPSVDAIDAVMNRLGLRVGSRD